MLYVLLIYEFCTVNNYTTIIYIQPTGHGVPQGLASGSVLFTMFVNDIPSIVLIPMFLFADDTKIFHFIRSSDDHAILQNDLNLLHEWSVRWQLKFSISKCKHVHFGPVYQFGPYYLNGITIDSVEFQKDLGILLTINLHMHHRSCCKSQSFAGIDQEIFRSSWLRYID